MTRSPVLVIAEAGVNHDGVLSRALELVDAAVESGADAVKFQSFSADELAAHDTPKVPYQEAGTKQESHWQMLKRLELSEDDTATVKAHCEARHIEFMSTPYGLRQVRFLDELGVRRFKVASADVVDIPLNQAIAGTGRPAIVSTGMATREEIAHVVSLYRAVGTDLTLLHATSAYPAPIEDLDMARIATLQRDHGVPVGFSDHSQSSIGAVLAIALGATVIEKHLTLDRGTAGPDHRASADPATFRDYVAAIRSAELAIGTGNYTRTPDEELMARTSRKALHSARDLPAGTVLAQDDLLLRRPGDGLPWSALPAVLGRRLVADLPAGAKLREDLLGDPADAP